MTEPEFTLADPLIAEGPEGFLSLRALASRRDIRSAFALMAGYAAVVLALFPWATLHGPPIPQSVAVFTTGIIVAEFATACLLLTLTGDKPDWLILFVSCAYLYSSLMGIAHVLTFPGAVLPDRPLLGGPQLTSYVFNVWRIGFAVLIVIAVLASDRNRKGEMTTSAWRRIVKACWYAIVALVAIGFAVALALERSLPVAVRSGEFTGVGLALSWIAAALGAFALASLLVKTRARQVLHLWLILAMTTFCGDLFLSTFSGGRFTLGWYAARASGFISGATLFVLFLTRFAAQQKLLLEVAVALRERGVNLQREVARRLKAEDQLVQSQKVEALGQLTGGIAHDFNNLLAVVVGNLDLVRATNAVTGPVIGYIDSALAAAERGTKLASQLLVFSRARLELKPLVASDVIAGMQLLLVSTLGPQIRVRIELNPARAAVLSERTQLELAILNLAINARDAMPDGGELTISVKSIRIEADAELTPGDYVRVSVADTGSGMEPGIAARAFEPFFTTKGPGRGTGLGLSQVFGIARRAGGTARIESRVGIGTTVDLFLRCTEIDPRAVTDGGRKSHLDETAPAIAILIVDDDPAVRELLVNMTSALGHSSTVAEDGARGLVAIERSQPDLVLVDFAMPGMNGAEFAGKLRDRHPQVPIVFVTGYADTGMIESVIDEHALILRKPFRSSELKTILAEVMRRRP
jgi:signal transduction histidine kinase/CheY-like chemotaxis protein